VKIKIAASMFLFSASFAVKAVTCPPIIPCNETGEASTIAGSNADIQLAEMATQISTDTNAVAQSIIDAAKTQSAALNKGASALTSTMIQVNQTNIEKQQQVKLVMNDAAMAHDTDMAEREVRRKSAIVSDDDTKAEFDVILNTLEQYADKTVPFTIAVLKQSYDDNSEGYVSVPIKESEGVCSDEDIEDGKCGTAKRAFLGSKLSTLFQQCSATKKALVQEQRQSESKATTIAVVTQRQKEVAGITSSAGAVQSRIAQANENSCSPTEFVAGICNQDLSDEEYQEQLMIGAKVPNGDVLASNFTTPSDTYADGYLDDLDEDLAEDIESAALDRDLLELNPEQTVVDIVDTYRNANQVKAAISFMDNIVGDDLVADLPINQRRDPGNAIAQSQYLQRMAGLSMVRTAMTDSMMKRVGTKMREYINTGKINDDLPITIDSSDHKESVAGAGTMDMLRSRVDEQMEKFSLSSDASDGQADFVNAASLAVIQKMQLESLKLSNDFLFERYLIAEQRVGLKAIEVSYEANSEDNISRLNKLRRGK
jgi:hypothetical protein